MRPPEEKVTDAAGHTLTARVWAILTDAYTAAGIDPSLCVVTQGSWHQGTLSGSTHNGGGAFDLRVWNLPSSKIEPLVVELRRRNVCAWKRDKVHGGFDPHIHGIVRDEPDLSSGAKWQVREYDAKRNGLTNGGPDYHPRPAQAPYRYGYTAPVVRMADLTGFKKSTSAALINDALVAEGLLPKVLRRGYWSPAAQLAFRRYRNGHGFGKDSKAAVIALGAKHGFTVA